MAEKGTKIIKTETLAMREMFEFYYQMGKDRSYTKVSEKFEVSETSIKRYARSFAWVTRVEQRDLANASELEKRTNETIVNSKAMYRETIRLLTDDFKERVMKGKMKINSVKAFVEIVQLDMELMGDDMSGEVDNVASLVDALKEGYRMIGPPEEDEGDGENRQ